MTHCIQRITTIGNTWHSNTATFRHSVSKLVLAYLLTCKKKLKIRLYNGN
ncbi:MAG: hypothetical protein ACI8ZM_002322 [Crocinitomix sp.]|jgi:hypothetical protein